MRDVFGMYSARSFFNRVAQDWHADFFEHRATSLNFKITAEPNSRLAEDIACMTLTVVACSPQRTEQKANISGTGPMGGSLGSLGFCESYKTSQPDFQTVATQGDSEEDGQLKPDSGYTMKRLAAEFMTAANLYCGRSSPKQATEFREKICEPISNASLLDRSIAKLRTARLKRPFLMRDERWEAEKKAMIESEARNFSQTYLLMYAECEGESLLKTK